VPVARESEPQAAREFESKHWQSLTAARPPGSESSGLQRLVRLGGPDSDPGPGIRIGPPSFSSVNEILHQRFGFSLRGKYVAAANSVDILSIHSEKEDLDRHIFSTAAAESITAREYFVWNLLSICIVP
jgi:hypothetical protein